MTKIYAQIVGGMVNLIGGEEVGLPYNDEVVISVDITDLPENERPKEGWYYINEAFVESITATLSEIQQQKIIELNTSCNEAILNGFISNCTGVEHQYKFDMEYQGNITQQGVMLTLDPLIDTVMWPTSDAGVLSHTREQFIQLCKDAQAWKATNIYRYFDLKSQVKACTEIAEVKEFTW